MSRAVDEWNRISLTHRAISSHVVLTAGVTVALLVFENKVAREGGVVVEQSGIFAQLNPDEVVSFH